jgi:hypothetical protein
MVAAVTSDDLVNVAVGLTASDIVPGLPLALRLGDGGVASETESLLHLGKVVDAHHLAATTLAEAICANIFPHDAEAPSVSADHLPGQPIRPTRDDGHRESMIKGPARGEK